MRHVRGDYVLILQIAKSRTIAVRLISMAMTGYYKTFSRPRQHRPLSMLKYDPVGTYALQVAGREQGADIWSCVVKKKVLFLEQKRGGSR